MKFNVNLEEFNNALKLCGRVLAAGESKYKNIYLVLDDKLHFYVESSQSYGHFWLIPQSIEIPGTVVITLKLLSFTDKLSGIAEFTIENNRAKIKTGPKNKINLAIEEVPAGEITAKTIPNNWTEISAQGFSKIIYASGPVQQQRDVVWITKNGAVCSDGYRFAVHSFPQEVPDEVVGLVFSTTAVSLAEEAVGLSWNKKHIWFKLQNGEVVFPKVEIGTPGPINILGNFIPSAKEGAIVRKDDLLPKIDLARRLSATSEQNFGVMEINLKEGLINIIPRGNELGSGDFTVTPTESSGEFSIYCRPIYLQEALQKSGNSVVLTTTNIEGIDLLTIIDMTTYHYIVPIYVNE